MPCVRSAISHWAARFVANGVDLTDFEEVTAATPSWNDWCRAWSERAAVHERLGREALDQKRLLSAGEHLQRAGVYYHFGAFLFVHDIPQMKTAHLKAVECRRPGAAAPVRRRASGSRSRTRASTCTASCASPPASTRPPVVVMAMGLDSTKEECDAYEQPFLARGIATLAFDGPGQGEGQYDFAIRGDYEVAVAAVVDYIETRRDLDAQAHRPLGRQPRRLLRAARRGVREAHQGLHGAGRAVQLGRGWDGLPELTREAFRVRSRVRQRRRGAAHRPRRWRSKASRSASPARCSS